MKFLPIQPLETPRLFLRKLTMADVPAYFERLGSSAEVTKYMLWNPHRDISESEASIRKVLQRYEEGTCYRWGIARKEDDSLIGIIDLLKFDEAENTCSFAYMLGKDFWGKGYGTEAVTAAFDFAFSRLGVSAILSDHFADNPASGAVMKKAGMQYTRTIPKKYEKNGILHDAVEYKITAKQWCSKNAIEVRPAAQTDAAALGAIMSVSFQSAFSSFISRETLDMCAKEESCIRLMQNLLAEGKMRFLLGILEGKPCGELVWSDGDTPDTAEIQAIHSLPESWGSGLGAALLHRALADMAAEGKQTVSLWAFQENKRARRFYEKHGFSHDGSQRISEFDGAVEVWYSRKI